MKFIFAILFCGWFVIYCHGWVQSLPPLLITSSTALAQMPQRFQQRPQQQLGFKKYAQFIIDPLERTGRSSILNQNAEADGSVEPHQQHQTEHPVEAPTDNEYDLNELFLAGEANANDDNDSPMAVSTADRSKEDGMGISQSMGMLPQEIMAADKSRAIQRQQPPQPNEPQLMTEFLTPLKYWTKQLQQPCQPSTVSGQDKCRLAEAYRRLLPSSDNYEKLYEKPETSDDGEPDVVETMLKKDASSSRHIKDFNIEQKNIITDQRPSIRPVTSKNDVMVNSERDLVKFLYWALQHLNPYHKSMSANAPDNNQFRLFDSHFWKKYNLSGRLEPPLVVDEPHYIIVRREKLPEDLQKDNRYTDDPFIPPRGRKHGLPDLNALLHRYETFVPNRGRRADIKDILRGNDVFFPNRGKKKSEMPLFNDQVQDKGMWPDLREIYKQPFLLQRLKLLCLRHLAGNKYPSEIYCDQQYNRRNHNEWAIEKQPMFPFKINGRDISVKLSVPTTTDTTMKLTRKSGEILNTESGIANDVSMVTRRRRIAPGFLAADGSVAANRLHSTRSMSAKAQRQARQQREQVRQLQKFSRGFPSIALPQPESQ